MTNLQIIGIMLISPYALVIFGVPTVCLYRDGGWGAVAGFWGVVLGILAVSGLAVLGAMFLLGVAHL